MIYDSQQSQSSQQTLALLPWQGRAIILLDLDAFFASVEQLDHPEWRGKPVIVGGSPDKRGVVSTASYEARRYGVHSAMPSSQAAKLCPDAIWTPGNYPRYIQLSQQVMEILKDESPFLQQVSIDEAFLDITQGRVCNEHPIQVAQRIQQRVEELGITCSIGLGVNKSVAKIASDQDKPRGLTVVYPGTESNFLAPLPISCMSGIGTKSAQRLKDFGIHTLGQVAQADEAVLKQVFGINAQMMRERCAGTEEAPIETDSEVKSVSNEVSFAQDLTQREDIAATITTLSEKVARRLRHKKLAGHTVTLKMRFEDRSIHTAQTKLTANTNEGSLISQTCIQELLQNLWAPGLKVRLIGVGVSDFEEVEQLEQMSLFDETSESQTKHEHLSQATDKVKNRFGEQAVRYGRELRMEHKDTGTLAQNKDDYKNPLR